MEEGEIAAKNSTVKLNDEVTRVRKDLIHESYLLWLDTVRPNSKERITNPKSFGTKFTAMARNKNKTLVNGTQKVSGKNVYEFAPIAKLLEAFNSKY